MRKLCWLLSLLGVLCAIPAQAELVEFYVGRDNRTAAFNSPPAPAGDGLPFVVNPNFNRLTLLYAHTDSANPPGNHYHGIGTYIFTGPSTSPVLNDTSGNRRIPEVSSGQPPLPLTAGSGFYAGKLVSKSDPGTHYSDLNLRSIDSLSGFASGTPEQYLFNSSAARWNQTLTSANIALELVSISPGLNVGSSSQLNLFPGGPGTAFTLGSGATLDFTPVFWVDAAAPPGGYSAEFRLNDSGLTRYGDSGRFSFDFQVVPEPSALVLSGIGMIGAFLSWRQSGQRRGRRCP